MAESTALSWIVRLLLAIGGISVGFRLIRDYATIERTGTDATRLKVERVRVAAILVSCGMMIPLMFFMLLDAPDWTWMTCLGIIGAALCVALGASFVIGWRFGAEG